MPATRGATKSGSPPVLLPDPAGVDGPESQVTLCVIAFAAQWNVMLPAGMVSGVGEKLLLATVIVVE